MASTTTEMGLKLWDAPGDFFAYAELAANFTKINDHDHTTGKGKALGANTVGVGQIQDNSITNAKVADNAIGTAEILAAAVTSAKFKPTMNVVYSSGNITPGNPGAAPGTLTDIPGCTATLTTGFAFNLIVVGIFHCWSNVVSTVSQAEGALNAGGVANSKLAYVTCGADQTETTAAQIWYYTGLASGTTIKLQGRNRAVYGTYNAIFGPGCAMGYMVMAA